MKCPLFIIGGQAVDLIGHLSTFRQYDRGLDGETEGVDTSKRLPDQTNVRALGVSIGHIRP